MQEDVLLRLIDNTSVHVLNRDSLPQTQEDALGLKTSMEGVGSGHHERDGFCRLQLQPVVSS